jgi:hypothetical protein
VTDDGEARVAELSAESTDRGTHVLREADDDDHCHDLDHPAHLRVAKGCRCPPGPDISRDDPGRQTAYRDPTTRSHTLVCGPVWVPCDTVPLTSGNARFPRVGSRRNPSRNQGPGTSQPPGVTAPGRHSHFAALPTTVADIFTASADIYPARTTDIFTALHRQLTSSSLTAERDRA